MPTRRHRVAADIPTVANVLHRALDELRSACAAANNAAAEAEANATASSSALQEQVVQVQQLQQRLDDARERHQYELRALRKSMAEQVKVIQADARAELEAAQTRLQLVRLKQQRMVSSMLSTDA
jgi:small-conductance mechanosensitive channel